MTQGAKTIADNIENYYFYHLDDLKRGKQIHWLIRHFLWFQDSFSRDLLREYRNNFVKPTEIGTRRYYSHTYTSSLKHRKKLARHTDIRTRKRQEYPELSAINRLLFRCLFAFTVYKIDTRPALRGVIPREQIVALRKRLLEHPKDIAVLSTPAVNFLSLSRWVYDLPPIPIKGYLELVQRLSVAGPAETERLLYLLTHAIIGETLFYTRPVKRNKEQFKQLLARADEAILRHASKIKLDTKIETLLCAKMLHKRMRCQKQVLTEVTVSQDEDNPYVIDVENIYRGASPTSPSASEHRNVLLIMLEAPTPTRFP